MIGNLTPMNPVPTPPPPSRVRKQSGQLVPRETFEDKSWVSPVVYQKFKRLFDLVGALTLSIFLVPIIAIVAVLVRLTSRGPAFYTQTRLGQFGQPFVIYKIRTMYNKCEATSGVRWSTKGDRRVTPLGKILRKLHIDEFPQLLNIIKGEMSLVGPRPERPEFFPILNQTVPNYPLRLIVKPGVTGLAQAYLPPDESLDTVRRKQIYDLHYIQTFSLLLDLRLIIMTAIQAAGVPHTLARIGLLMPHPNTIEPRPIDPSTRPTPQTSKSSELGPRPI